LLILTCDCLPKHKKIPRQGRWLSDALGRACTAPTRPYSALSYTSTSVGWLCSVQCSGWTRASLPINSLA